MTVFASSLHAWESLEEQEGIKVPHGLVFPLAVVQAICGEAIAMEAEEHCPQGPAGFDAVFISVLDSRCMINTARHFRAWNIPIRAADRDRTHPLVWAGGSGLHNPAPYGAIADLIVHGDAETPLPVLLDLWHEHGNSDRFLTVAADVPGVWVPSIHGRQDFTLVQQVADDISVTLRHNISVNHDGRRRVEIARGCKFSCAFCSLGWRTPLRENTPEDVIQTIRLSSKLVHLQAGDAESHSGIDEIRESLVEHGGFDSGWTGRLDSLLENPDQSVPGQKRYAFGVEGVTYRLRHAVGKAYLTDDRLVEDTVRFFSMVEGDGKGRAAWHIIAGLPTETLMDVRDLGGVVKRIDREMMRQRGTRRNLALHWQPFTPLPGTPMQWCSAGGGARRATSALSDLTRLSHVGVRHVTGRTDRMARICTVLSRADERAVELFEAYDDGGLTEDVAAGLVGVGWGVLDPEGPLPWDFVRAHKSKGQLRTAHGVVMARLERSAK